MARKKRDKIRERDITGLKYFDQLAPLLERLHDDACQRDKAGNRRLHFDQYCLLILLYLFNPIVTSLRGIQQASELANVQKKLGVPRTSLGSLSEAATVFDAERLKAIIGELGAELKPLGRDARLKDIPLALTLVDGTLITALPKLMEASWRKSETGSGLVKWRLHTHFEVDRYVPRRMDVTPDGGGEHDERSVLERTIESDRLYVMDRGYAKFALFNRIVAAKSSYVCRLRDNSTYEVVEERVLTDADRAAGILSDQIVRIGQNGKVAARPDHKIRLICVKCSPHTSRGKYKGSSTGPGSDGILRIATNLLEVPAEIIALIYSERWTIEIFFRFFKHLLGGKTVSGTVLLTQTSGCVNLYGMGRPKRAGIAGNGARRRRGYCYRGRNGVRNRLWSGEETGEETVSGTVCGRFRRRSRHILTKRFIKSGRCCGFTFAASPANAPPQLAGLAAKLFDLPSVVRLQPATRPAFLTTAG